MDSRPHRRLWFPLGLGLFLLFAWCGCENLSFHPPLVGVSLWTKEIHPFEESLQGVVEGLREQGYQDGLNLRLKVVNADGDRGKTAAAARNFLEQRAQLLITVGNVPTLVALEVTRDRRLPLVYATVAAPAATGIYWPGEPARASLTGPRMGGAP